MIKIIMKCDKRPEKKLGGSLGLYQREKSPFATQSARNYPSGLV